MSEKQQRCKECGALLVEIENGKLVCLNPADDEHPIAVKQLVADYEKWLEEEQSRNGF